MPSRRRDALPVRDWLQGVESHHRPSGYEPVELLLLYPALKVLGSLEIGYWLSSIGYSRERRPIRHPTHTANNVKTVCSENTLIRMIASFIGLPCALGSVFSIRASS